MCEDLDETLCAGCGFADCKCENDDEHSDTDSDLHNIGERDSLDLDTSIDQE